MNWRPKNWNKTKKYNYYVEIDEEVFEAGADAILEALRANGEHIEKDKYYSSPCGACSSDEDCRAYESGRLVLIPEEVRNEKTV